MVILQVSYMSTKDFTCLKVESSEESSHYCCGGGESVLESSTS